MPGRRLERGHDLPLRGAMAHERAIAAPAKREAERVEKDGLSGAGLAGQHGQAPVEGKIERVDENDVADGEPDQHGPLSGSGRPCA